MDTSTIYAIVVGGSFCLLLLMNGFPLFARLIRYLAPLVSQHLVYCNVLNRHRLLGPWTRAGVMMQLIYFAGNACCLRFWDTTASQAGLRAGTLAVINMIPLFAIPYLGSLAHLLGVTLGTTRQIHRSAGVMAAVLTMFHVLIMMASQSSFPLSQPKNMFAVIGASSVSFIVLLSVSLFRRPSYETYLRTHQALAALAAYSIWQHLPSKKDFPARISVRIRIQLQKPLDIKAGQAINLWIPSVSFWSFLQSHPFVVISWANKPQDHINLFIGARRSLTRELLYHAKSEHTMNPWVLFSGPYGKSVPMENCENILMVASDFGIAAHLPYLKQLIHGYKARGLRSSYPSSMAGSRYR
ncbi:putative metalloreductase [Calycina marina]|uniref:Metalloreductase n=1 Tax=Calycina marina TaxID=1763456 RepID=A0A9P7ZB54_9HELO|nr:putative metalloreductase [Calycina marina]